MRSFGTVFMMFLSLASTTSSANPLSKTNQLQNLTYSHIRGFSYQPSFGGSGQYVWGDQFDVQTIVEEMKIGLRIFPKVNALRLWMSPDAFVLNPKRVTDDWTNLLDTVRNHPELAHLKFVVTLWNAWSSFPEWGVLTESQIGWSHDLYPGSGGYDVFQQFLNAIVRPQANNPQILTWDIMNEPPINTTVPSHPTTPKIYYNWLKYIRNYMKRNITVSQPVGISQANCYPFCSLREELLDLSDVWLIHPYWIPPTKKSEYRAFLDEVVVRANAEKKAVLCTETCWGYLDNKKRATTCEFQLAELVSRGIGIMPHALHWSKVADLHRPGEGPISGAGYMAFVEKNNSLRQYHGFYNKF